LAGEVAIHVNNVVLPIADPDFLNTSHTVTR
jgi:hypothetical protein